MYRLFIKSSITELLSRATKMPVIEVKDNLRVEPDHVCVIPPNTSMAIRDGTLKLVPRKMTRGQHMPIDYFLRSLAEDQRNKAIGIILSGTASDGSLGVKAIKAEGGITFAQDEKSARYYGMPHSAVATGCVDFILPPDEIARELVRIGRHPYIMRSEAAKTGELPLKGKDTLNKIFSLLRTATGVDFTHYKRTTIKRRMAVYNIARVEDYVKYLQDHPNEAEALYQDILITVTNFFRNPETFEALKKKVFPKLARDRSPDETIRVWVPGCATGEEAYSIAICLLEFLGDIKRNIPVQIFATDISDTALEKARAGTYFENIASDVSPERLKRFFSKVDRGYQISKAIREMCIFAKHNMIKDTPFHKLDLISCRNVLIYMEPILQKRIIQIFHYALKPTGFLVLGNLETIGHSSNLFAVADKKHRIYSKRPASVHLQFDFATSSYVPAGKEDIGKRTGEDAWRELDVQKEIDHIILTKYGLAGVLINNNMEILQFRGEMGPYLAPASGDASLNLLKMVPEDLQLELRAAVHKAKKSDVRIRTGEIRVKYKDQFRDVNVEVIPVKAPRSGECYFLVLFEDVSYQPKKTKPGGAKPGKAKEKAEGSQVNKLKQQLARTRAYLQATIREQEATNEELRAANEEIMSSNEELQSINEELETTKEELQSANEEMTTLNEELQHRNIEVGAKKLFHKYK